MLQYCPQCGTPADIVTGACPKCAPAFAPQPMTTTSLPFYQAPPASQYSGQWNWGAFFLNPLWLMNHGQVGLGAGVLICSFLPFVNILALVSSIYYGIKGNDIAMRYRAFSSEAQFVAVQNAWRNWGIGLFVAGIVLSVVGAIFLGIMAAMLGHSAHSY